LVCPQNQQKRLQQNIL